MDDNIERLESKSKVRMSTGVNIVGFVLTIMAGWIDTVAVKFFVNECASFMTGRAKLLGLHLYNFDLKSFLGVLLVVIAFIIGSLISTVVTKKRGLRGGLLLTGILVIISTLPISWKYIITIFLPMAMGSQNAATSSTPINRTTHLTGPVTDIGMNLARKNWSLAMFWIWRLIGFTLGTLIGFNVSSMVDNSLINKSIVLIIPGIIIILTGIIQKKILDIPLSD